MEVLIKKASDRDYEEIKNFKSLNEFWNFLKKTYNKYILDFDRDIIEVYTKDKKIVCLLRIYDDYVE